MSQSSKRVSPKGRTKPASKPGRFCEGCGRVKNPLTMFRFEDYLVCYNCIRGAE